ncbi:signal peptidase I [Blautia acetigignens]
MSERRNKKETEQLFNMPEITRMEKKALSGAREKLEDSKLRKVLIWVFEIVVTLIFAVLTSMMLFQSVTMQESSMEPTLAVGSQYFVNKLAYKTSSPKRGDIIVFRTNGSDDAALHVRRVIGLPGETIQIVNGRILINGEAYKEGKDFPSINNPGMAANAITLEAGEYFVLGDNRNNSEDSRYADIGKVNKKYITGKLWFQISPRKEIGLLDQ